MQGTTGPTLSITGDNLTRNEVFRYIFWEWIEPIGSALCIALIVMEFIVALYVIPTGSMQPTLQGGNDYGIGDKVLVNKFVYDQDSPERWDVIVFDYPYKNIDCSNCGITLVNNFDPDAPEVIPPGLTCHQESCTHKSLSFNFNEKEYIKRCVGLPGDEISIRDGNIVLWDVKQGKWQVPQKTQEAQEDLWVKAWDSDKDDHLGLSDHYWKGQRRTLQAWHQGQLSLSPTTGTLVFHNQIARSGHGDKGQPSPINAPPCGDFAIDIQLDDQAQNGQLGLDISRNIVSHKAEIDFTAKKIKITIGRSTLAEIPLIPSIERIRFARVDGTLQLQLDDKQHLWPIPEFNANVVTKTSFPKISYRGDNPLKLKRLQLLRDIYYSRKDVYGNRYDYLTGPRESAKLMRGEFFAMGDNSFHSSDSRDWGPVPEKKLIGKALMVLFPFGRTKFIH